MTSRVPTAERRQVTVMYLRAERAVEPTRSANYMGDGVLVYFGCMQAHEDEAERAGAGLELVQAVGSLNQCSTGTPVRLATGLSDSRRFD
jgi:class 3 adenylate cyclase